MAATPYSSSELITTPAATPSPTAGIYVLHYQIKHQTDGVMLKVWEPLPVETQELPFVFAIHVKLPSPAAALIWLREYLTQLSGGLPPQVRSSETGAVSINPNPTVEIDDLKDGDWLQDSYEAFLRKEKLMRLRGEMRFSLLPQSTQQRQGA
ncbi:MAG: hypothetical protein VKK80_02900 [Prochlorothrix sp.]|nr:hypothetical protein [Prochlorothrix sp.]